MRTLFAILLLLAAVSFASGRPSFKLSVTPQEGSIGANEQALFKVAVIPVDGFEEVVRLQVFTSDGSPTYFLTSPNIAPTYIDTAKFLTSVKIPAKARRYTLEVWAISNCCQIIDTVAYTVHAEAEMRGWTLFGVGSSPIGSHYVVGICRSQDGLTWVGTRGGAFAYDGANWMRHYGGFSAIAADSTDGVWLGEPGKIQRYHNYSWTTYVVPLAGINSLAVSPDHTVYASGTEGVQRFDGVEWKPMEGSPGLQRIIINHEGEIFGWDAKRMWDFDGNSWSEIPFDQIRFGRSAVKSATVDRNNRIWFAVYDANGFIVPLGAPEARFRAPWEMSDLAIDGNGAFWVTTWFGHALWRYADSVWIRWDSLNSGMPNSRPTVVHAAPDGAIWVGTEDAGVAVYRPEGPSVAPALRRAPDVLDLW